MKVIILSILMVLAAPTFADNTSGGFWSNFWSGSESAKGDAKGEAKGKFSMELEGGARGEANGEQRMLGTGDGSTSARTTDK